MPQQHEEGGERSAPGQSEVHELREDDPAATPPHAEWCDEEEDRCSPRPASQGRRMALERPDTVPEEGCDAEVYPGKDELSCDGVSGRSGAAATDNPKRRCPRVKSDPLW